MVSPLPSIVTLAQAKKAARITSFDDDDDLYLRLEIAHEWCLEYLNNRLEDDDTDGDWLDTMLAWDSSNAPRQVKGAILHTFVHLVRYRGDDAANEQPALENSLPPLARAMLDRYRDPTIA
jgi:hypothetical protein